LPNLAICTYEQLPLEQHKKIEKKEKKRLIRRVFLFTKLKKSFVDVDSSFYVCKMMKIHPKKTL
jgi:hypothetical protein